MSKKWRGCFCILGLLLCSWAHALEPQLLVADDKTFAEKIVRLSLSTWLQQLKKDPVDFICLGELHEDIYRRFYATQILPFLHLDQLFVESSASEWLQKRKESKNFEHPIDLLGADIAGVIQSARKTTPGILINGVDASDAEEGIILKEQLDLGRTFKSREGFIAAHIKDYWDAGAVHAALFGAQHCAMNDLGLGAIPFLRLLLEEGLLARKKIKTVRVFFASEMNFFTAKMQLAGLGGESFVIDNAQTVDAKIFNYSWQMQEIFNNYTTIIYIANNSPGLEKQDMP